MRQIACKWEISAGKGWCHTVGGWGYRTGTKRLLDHVGIIIEMAIMVQLGVSSGSLKYTLLMLAMKKQAPTFMIQIDLDILI